jgi:Pentapeptide repeats (8 copies)
MILGSERGAELGLKGSAMGSDGFEPPKYLASLITAVNDGGKAAQAGALIFMLVGLYLLATAFSVSDEDLLMGRTMAISQVGASLPVSFSFAIAPFVFVFLHIYTLVRFDMLAANIRQFLAELQHTVVMAADQERCRQLLTNVEFIQALVSLPGSPLYSPVWRWLFRAIMAIFPVVVLLLVQINALRYQGYLINWMQRVALLIDLCVLVWFFRRNPLGGSSLSQRRFVRTRRWAELFWLPVVVTGLNFLYLNVVPAEADVKMVRYANQPEPLLKFLVDILRQPLDVMLCPRLNWGCRYLRVDHRTLIDRTYDNKAIAELRSGGAQIADALTAIDGLLLRGRSLRFGEFEGISLFGADLSNADLRKADLTAANLQGAQLFMATPTGRRITAFAADICAAVLCGPTECTSIYGPATRHEYVDRAAARCNLARGPVARCELGPSAAARRGLDRSAAAGRKLARGTAARRDAVLGAAPGRRSP